VSKRLREFDDVKEDQPDPAECLGESGESPGESALCLGTIPNQGIDDLHHRPIGLSAGPALGVCRPSSGRGSLILFGLAGDIDGRARFDGHKSSIGNLQECVSHWAGWQLHLSRRKSRCLFGELAKESPDRVDFPPVPNIQRKDKFAPPSDRMTGPSSSPSCRSQIKRKTWPMNLHR
jgi:hypothetical protein